MEINQGDESLPVTSSRNRKSRCCSCHCWMLYCRSDRGERPSPVDIGTDGVEPRCVRGT